jgi:hypothetical protein
MIAAGGLAAVAALLGLIVTLVQTARAARRTACLATEISS